MKGLITKNSDLDQDHNTSIGIKYNFKQHKEWTRVQYFIKDVASMTRLKYRPLFEVQTTYQSRLQAIGTKKNSTSGQHTREPIQHNFYLADLYRSVHTAKLQLQAPRGVQARCVSVCDEMRARKFCICVMFRDIQVTEEIRGGRGQGRGETYWKEMADSL